jgi:hypothetical protein
MVTVLTKHTVTFSNWELKFTADGLWWICKSGSGIAADGTISHPYNRANGLLLFLNTKVSEFHVKQKTM